MSDYKLVNVQDSKDYDYHPNIWEVYKSINGQWVFIEAHDDKTGAEHQIDLMRGGLYD